MTQEDVENVVTALRESVRVRDEHRVLHVIPQGSTPLTTEGIKSVGLSGVRMQASTLIIPDMAKNIVKAVERCGLKKLTN